MCVGIRFWLGGRGVSHAEETAELANGIRRPPGANAENPVFAGTRRRIRCAYRSRSQRRDAVIFLASAQDFDSKDPCLHEIRTELGRRFVEPRMTRQKVPREGHPARPVGSLFALSLCLAVGLLLMTAGTALGISGFATPETAVRAQYPDAPGASRAKPVVSSLDDIMRVTRKAARDRDPTAARRFREAEHVIALKARSAVLSSAGIDTRQSGSIALLAAGIAVLSVGGVLRWRRDRLQI